MKISISLTRAFDLLYLPNIVSTCAANSLLAIRGVGGLIDLPWSLRSLQFLGHEKTNSNECFFALVNGAPLSYR